DADGRHLLFRLQNDSTPATGGTPTVDVINRILTIVGTAGNDLITLQGDDEFVQVVANNVIHNFDSPDLDRISILGGEGNDYIDLRAQRALTGTFPVTLDGGNGNDILVGSQGNDRITGGNNDDRINGWEGDDWISGNAQKDRIDGSEGDDSLNGNGGRD